MSKPTVALAPKNCKECTSEYTPTSNNSLYCPECRKDRTALWGHSKWDKTPQGIAHKRQYHIQLVKSRKKLVYDHYGWLCRCCGETNELFLSIDHVNNDGNTDEWRGRSAPTRYKKIIDKGYPDSIQILCMNCNWGKRMNKGVCPHV